MNSTTRYLPFLGRLLLGLPFIMSGLTKIGGYAFVVSEIQAAGLPFAPLGWALAIAIEVGVGLALVLGYRARPAALVLALWCLATALVAHTHFADQNQMIHFLKNVMMAGGLLQIVHFGAGAISFDARKGATQTSRDLGSSARSAI